MDTAPTGDRVSLFVSMGLFYLVVVIGVFIFVARFSHPDDDTGVVPKIISLLCFVLCFSSIIVVPVTGITKSLDFGINVNAMFNATSTLLILFLLTVIPFSLFFFKSAFVGMGTTHLKQRLMHGFICVGVILVLTLIIVLLSYFFDKSVDISFLNYTASIFLFVGWFPFSVFVGLGFLSLPMTFFFSWYNRPSPILLEDYETKREDLGKKARDLRVTGERLSKDFENQNFFEKQKTKSVFVNAVNSIKEDYVHLQTAFLFKGGNPIWPWIQLILSIFFMILNILIITQIIIFILVNPPLYDLFGAFLEAVNFDGFFLLTFFFCILFGVYLFCLSLYGQIQVSSFLPFLFAGYKMEVHNTFNDAFLVNSGIFVLISLPVIHFCYQLFGKFTLGTTGSDFFASLSKGSKTLKLFFSKNIFYYIILFLILMTGVLYFFYPPNKAKRLENELGKITKSK